MTSFYHEGSLDIRPADLSYSAVRDPIELYQLLMQIYCAATCAPRMRQNWSEENKTLGQCSVTAFLAQDIFGGEVYGIPLEDGSIHCYNAVKDAVFDLTSEQFLPEKLEYRKENPQKRSEHFRKQEKYARYLYLKDQLNALLSQMKVAHSVENELK